MGAGSKSSYGKWNSAHACGAICAIGFLCLMYNWFLVIKHRELEGSRIAEVMTVPKEGYCQAPVGRGAEGVPPLEGLELRAVVLTIRHGDRSAIQGIPGSSKTSRHRFSCASDGLQSIWDWLPQRYKIVSAEDPTTTLQRSFSPLLKSGSNDECRGGQLTAKGFQQHLTLGTHLNSAYQLFLSKFRHEGNIYVRSTDFTRTIASVAALLTNFLPLSVWGDAITIEVNPDAEAEVMHGKGVHSTAKAGDGGSERSFEGSCPAAVTQSARQFDSMTKLGSADKEEVERLFGTDAANRIGTDLADPLHAFACHGMPLPCGPGGCATGRLATALFDHSDRLYCDRFAGENGGSRATQLMFYPFLHEIFGFLQRAADGPKLSLAVYSGHDTVIAPLLSALGVYKGSLCQWPSYASRIAFELYEDKEHSDESLSMSPRHYVRVLYNGEVLRGLRGCEAKNGELCPLDEFAKGVAALLGGAPDFETACAK